MPTDPTRAEVVFVAAAEMTDPAARALFVAEACGGDLHLQSRVEALLRAHDQPDSLLDAPLVAPPDPEHAATRAYAPNPDTEATGTSAGGTDPSDDEPLTFLSPATRSDSLGRLGHYEMLQVLGRGGFGIVFRAFDDMLQRVVAVKVMAPQIATLSPARKRFLREARSSAAVRHENVVQVYEVGEQPLPHLVMEFIPGETLQQKLDRNGPLEVPEVLRIGRQIAEGLAAAHACDLIHRDIKPGNILLEGGSQKVKITDFGLARAADDASISQSGVIAGTPLFMAPEQALGHHIDQRADLFSLGSVLYQMVSGRPPFRAPTALAVLKRVAEESPRPIPEIIPETPAWLCGIISKLHAKNPDDRYQSAREVADVLADCEAQLKANSKLTDFSRIPVAKPTPRRSRRWRWVTAAALLLLAAGAIAFGPHARRYIGNRGEVELIPEPGWVSMIALRDDNTGTDWVDVKDGPTIKLPPGKYHFNAGFAKYERTVGHWEVTTHSLLSSHTVLNFSESPEFEVVRGERYTIRAVMRDRPGIQESDTSKPTPVVKQEPPLAIAPFDADQAKKHQEAWAKHLAVPVEMTNSIGMKMCLIPPGEFTMGTSTEEIDRLIATPGIEDWYQNILRSEAPARRVAIPQPFLMGACEVTVDQFRKFIAATKYKTQAEQTGGGYEWRDDHFEQRPEYVWNNPNYSASEVNPVGFIALADAVAFCTWLSKVEGRRYHVPTEEQWEYACRAGTATRFFFGDDETRIKEFGWMLPYSGGQFHAVGCLRANPFGLFDIYGNASELTIDPAGQPVFRGNSTKGLRWQRARSAARWLDHARIEPVSGFRVLVVGDLVLRNLPPPPPVVKQEPLPPTFKNSIGMEFVIVPKGKSWLGGDKDRLGDKEVVIPADFYLGKYEVTQEEWEKVMGENPSFWSRTSDGKDAVTNVSDADLKRFPVENVSWDQCQIFVEKLNRLEKESGWVYRLPKMAEWEYACRGGPMSGKLDSGYDFYFYKPTNTLPPDRANFDRGFNRPVKVGSYEPNRLGLFDMHGNVAEWCDDIREEEGPKRYLRGGCFLDDARTCRAQRIGMWQAPLKGNTVGLRLARVPSGTPSPEAKTPGPLAKQEPLPPTYKNSIGMEFVIVPKGKSWLGGGKDKLGDQEVEIPADFYLAKYEVTQEEWVKVMGKNPSNFSRGGKSADAVMDIKDDDLKRFPVECVSWQDAQAFVNLVNARTKKERTETRWEYRLPTEEQWEYACRGGPMADRAESAFDFYLDKPATTLAKDQANFTASGLKRTTKVGSYPPNRLGLHDMQGNVLEWCEDHYGGGNRVIRGGAWTDELSGCRAARRDGRNPNYAYSNAPSSYRGYLGFRVARVPTGAPPHDVKMPPKDPDR